MATIEDKVIEWESELSSVLNGCNSKITEKGGVPAQTLMGLENAIGTITSSGGTSLPSGVISFASGEFTPGEDITTDYEVTYNLEAVPTFFNVVAVGDFIVEDNAGYQLFQTVISKMYTSGDSPVYGYRYVRYVNNNGAMVTNSGSIQKTYITKTKACVSADPSLALKAGVTYRWVAIAVNN